MTKKRKPLKLCDSKPLTRRYTLSLLSGVVTAVASSALANEQDKIMTEDTATYNSNGIQLKDFERYWPKPHKVPRLILDVAALIAPWPWGVLSHFYIVASRPNDYWLENGADLWSQFGMFIGIANGTEYALWYYDGCPPGAEPVVSFDDEGSLRILAPNLKAFFTAWATGAGVGMLEPFDYDATPEVLASRKAYGAKLMARIAQEPNPPSAPPPPDFGAFINNFGDAAQMKNAADPTLQAIAKLLQNYFPANNDNPRGKSFTLKGDGDNITVETGLKAPDYVEYEPLPEREALIPLIKRARLERAAAQNDGRGLWISGVLYLQHGGHAFISADWP